MWANAAGIQIGLAWAVVAHPGRYSLGYHVCCQKSWEQQAESAEFEEKQTRKRGWVCNESELAQPNAGPQGSAPASYQRHQAQNGLDNVRPPFLSSPTTSLAVGRPLASPSMPSTQRQRAPSPDPNDIELTRLERDGGLRPSPMLQVTTQLHPFWHTKRGMALLVVVVLALVGAVVGGVIGGTKGKNDGSKKDLGSPQMPVTTNAATSSTANSTTSAHKSTTTKRSSSAAKTDSTTLAARAYPIRRDASEASDRALPSAILSLAAFTPVISPAMLVQVQPTMTSPPS